LSDVQGCLLVPLSCKNDKKICKSFEKRSCLFNKIANQKQKKVYKIWPSKKRLNELFHNLSPISIGKMSFAKMPAFATAAMNGHAATWR